MSDIFVHVNTSDDSSVRNAIAGNAKKKNRKFQKRMRFLKKMGYLKDKAQSKPSMGQSVPRETPLKNGETSKYPSPPISTQKKSLPQSASAAASSSTASVSAHSHTSLTVTVTNQDKNPKPTAAAPSCAMAVGPLAAAKGLPSKYVAIDCEMVGTGPKGRVSQLARCSIVSYDGDVVYDKFIRPSVPVTDYRTRWSGIRHKDLVKATPYTEARKEILRLLAGKVVIGHAIHNDFKVLGYAHPSDLTRDTSRISLLNQKAGFAEHECASLKRLTKAIFNRDIQAGKKGHSSVEDAKATMELYKVVEEEWEKRLATKC